MPFHRPTLSDFSIASGYFLTAALAVSLTRLNGGVALLWLGAALLIPALAYRPREKWATLIAMCAVASTLATGLLGLGWKMAPAFAVINMVEAYVGAALLARARGDTSPLASLAWLGRFIVAAGIAAPGTVALLAGAALATQGLPFVRTAIDFYVGHALCNLTFVPIFSLLMSGALGRLLRGFTRAEAIETAGLILLVAAVTAAAFAQSELPLLFLPFGPIIVAIFRGGKIGAAMSIVMLALIGGGLTAAGHGPIQLIDAPYAVRMQFFQFYLASVVLTVLPVTADLRNRARLFRELRFSEERYRMLADHSGDIMMHIDLDGRVRFVSPSIRQLGGYEPDEMIGRMATDFVADGDVEHVAAAHDDTVAARGATHRFEYRGAMRDGSERWFETLSRAVLDRDGEPDAVLSVIRDVSERKRAEQNLTAAAMTDSLTGLPNRRAFRAAALKALGSSRPVLGCIAVIDLDHFKRINDLHGHDGGDAVLRQFAARASVCLREGDMVARIGGEEFGLLLPAATIDDAARICERLRQSVAAMVVPSPTGGIRVTVSGGVAELGSDGLDAALKRADLALYEAKGGGRDQLCLAA